MIQMIMHGRVKYRTKSCGERAGQRRDRKRESVRDRVLLKMRDGVGNKSDHWRKYLWQMWEMINMVANACFPTIRIFSLLIC
jgi:hypothetical protein